MAEEVVLVVEMVRLTGTTARDTHTTSWLPSIWDEVSKDAVLTVDPFARDCGWCSWTNDIDTETGAEFHLDAAAFLARVAVEEPGRVDLVLFDPPFSPRQAEEKYASGHVNVYQMPGYVRNCFTSIALMLRPGGKVLKLGYNTNRHHPLLALEKVWVVAVGANRNDVLVSLWRREPSLDDF